MTKNVVDASDAGFERQLRLNEGEGIHSIYTPGYVLNYGIWDLFLAAPFLNNPPFTAERVKSMCLIGLAGVKGNHPGEDGCVGDCHKNRPPIRASQAEPGEGRQPELVDGDAQSRGPGM